jgi:hypothetical protein
VAARAGRHGRRGVRHDLRGEPRALAGPLTARAVLTAGLLLGAAAPAHALTVRGETTSVGGYKSPVTLVSTVYADAAAGEVNRLVATFGTDKVTVSDSGAPVTGTGTCSAIDEHSVSCPVGNFYATLGDGDDTARAACPSDCSYTTISFEGDDGADVLTAPQALSKLAGGPGDDTITGGAGRDEISGDAGHDTIAGGAGDDIVHQGDDPGGMDAIDGGDGADLLSYAGTIEPVIVDLAARSAGISGALGDIAGIEGVTGGAAPDVLLGDSGPNIISGADPGAPTIAGDTIDGRGGADVLRGTPRADAIEGGEGADDIDGLGGADTVSGGPGDDTVGSYGKGGRPHLRCGAGRDRFAPAYPGFSRAPVVAPDCERFAFVEDVDALLRVAGRRLTLAVQRPASELNGPCRFSFRLGGRPPVRTVRVPVSKPRALEFGLPARWDRLAVAVRAGCAPKPAWTTLFFLAAPG